MQLILEDNFEELDYSIELNESTGSKTYVVKGTFSTPGKKNRNGRIYGQKLWEDNVASYQNELHTNSVNTLMEAEHPARTSVDMWKAVGKIRKLEMREGLVYGEAVILNNNTPESNQLKALVDAGVPIGVSTRGVGRLGKNNIVEEFKLITVDFVSTPSDYNAQLKGFSESLILEDKEFNYDEKSKNWVCSKEGCSLVEAQKETKAPKKCQLLNTLTEYIQEIPELTESEIKARLLVEGQVKQKFAGYDFIFDGKKITMFQDKKELISKEYPSLTSVQMKKMITNYEKDKNV